MKTVKFFKRIALASVIAVSVNSATGIAVDDIAEGSQGSDMSQLSSYSSQTLSEISFFNSQSTTDTMSILIKKLNELVSEQNQFYKKYESGKLNSNQEIAKFKIDLALLEFQTNDVLESVDAFLESDEFESHAQVGKDSAGTGLSASNNLTAFDQILELEENQRTRIETLISTMKYRQDAKFFKHQLNYTIKIGN